MSDTTYMPVSHARARVAIRRLINSHFLNANRAMTRIPADPENDDDLVAMRYTNECESAMESMKQEIAGLKAQNEQISELNLKLHAKLARLSAPVTDEYIDKIMTQLYRRFREWSKHGFGPDDVTWCEVKADVLTLLAACAAKETA